MKVILENILLDQKSYGNILIYEDLYKKLIGGKHLLIRFNKIGRFIIVFDRNRYLILFGAEKYGFIYNTIRYLIGITSLITHVICHNSAKIKINSYSSLHLEKILTMDNGLTLICVAGR